MAGTRKVVLNGREYVLNEYPHLGKYEGGLVIDAFVDSLDADESIGDVETGHYGRINGPITDGELTPTLTGEEVAYLKAVPGCIVHTNSQGFVDVTYYDTDADLQKMWEQVTQGIEDAEATAAMEAFSEETDS